MNSEPCARLMTRMMPNTSVTPTAIRNSIRPNCTPLKSCSTRSASVMTAPCGPRRDRKRPTVLAKTVTCSPSRAVQAATFGETIMSPADTSAHPSDGYRRDRDRRRARHGTCDDARPRRGRRTGDGGRFAVKPGRNDGACWITARKQGLHDQVVPVDCDVTQWRDCEAAVTKPRSTGSARVHGLVNNAGIGMQGFGHVQVGPRKGSTSTTLTPGGAPSTPTSMARS